MKLKHESIITTCLFLIFFFSCKGKKNESVSEKAKDFNNQAMTMYINNQLNGDSLNYALDLIDRAIAENPENIAFYYNKVEILKNLKMESKRLEILSLIIQKDSLDFKAYFLKGQLFSTLKNYDSSNIYFYRSLDAIEKSHLLKSVPIVKDFKRIEIYKLVRDSINYHKYLTSFKETYKGQADYEKYLNELEDKDN